MAYTVWQCDYEIRKLSNALNQINNIRSYLSNYINNVDMEISRLSNAYTINGDASNSVNRLRSLRSNANETSNYLKNTITPRINNTIYNLKKKKRELEAEDN